MDRGELQYLWERIPDPRLDKVKPYLQMLDTLILQLPGIFTIIHGQHLHQIIEEIKDPDSGIVGL